MGQARLGGSGILGMRESAQVSGTETAWRDRRQDLRWAALFPEV